MWKMWGLVKNCWVTMGFTAILGVLESMKSSV
jgi:hypothetical protein